MKTSFLKFRLAAIVFLTISVGLIAALASEFSSAQMTSTLNPSAPAKGTPPPRRKQQREAYKNELTHQLKENHVPCNVNLDCEALAVGAMACGGPKEYLAVSKATISKIRTAVTELTRTIEEMDQIRNQENGQMGICLAIAKPDVICKSGSCECKSGSCECKSGSCEAVK